MAESYFKDPLLAKWEASTPADVLVAIANWPYTPSPEADPLDVYDWLFRAYVTGREMPCAVHLRIMICAELSGARRARERLDSERKGCVISADGRGCTSCEALGRVLEAFDGE